MKTINDNNNTDKVRVNPMYRSGSAARLSGVPVETLRVWERRYKLVSPSRSAHGHREYSMDEIKHLSVIKQLVDRGNPIGAIAHLHVDELRAMLDQQPMMQATNATVDYHSRTPVSLIRTFIVARRMSGCLADINRSSGAIDVVGHCSTLQLALKQQDLAADLLLVEISEINQIEDCAIDAVRKQVGAGGVVILYRFARHESVQKLRAAGYLVARIPTDMDELDSLCRLALSVASKKTVNLTLAGDLAEAFPVALFDDQALAAIATAATGIYCECPRHLVEILQMLGSFERYSAQCENRDARDEVVHRQILHATVQARVIIETVLEKVVRVEGLPVPLKEPRSMIGLKR